MAMMRTAEKMTHSMSPPLPLKQKRRKRIKQIRTLAGAMLAARNIERWNDPATRPAQMAIVAARAAAQRADPTKNWSRRGVFDGYTRAESQKIWARANERAETIVNYMTENNMVEPSATPEAAEMAGKALQAAVAVMDTPANQVVKLQAARLVLDFTKAKPASKSEVTVKTAEDWLKEVAADAGVAPTPAE